MKQRILVVAEEAPVRATLARWLMAAGYAVELAESPKRAREVIQNETIALGIVAPQRLGAAALDLARELRGSIGRLIVVTEPSADAGSPIAETFESDGSISKPLTEAEVLERVSAALPARPTPAGSPDILHFGGHTLDLGARQCRALDGEEIPLTRGEFATLVELARQAGRVVSRDALRQAVGGRDASPDDRSVDMLISRLRRKIERDPKQPRIIVTVPGGGYRLLDAQSQDRVPAKVRADPPAVETVQAATKLAAPDAQRPRNNARWMGLAALAGIAAALIALWFSGAGTRGPALTAVGRFDASVVPLVNDTMRAELEAYSSQPDFKAIAISVGAYGMAIGARDASSAQAEALERCKERSSNRYCRPYASGTDVVWSVSSLPLPLRFDVHDEPLQEAFDAATLPLSLAGQMETIQGYMGQRNHRALAFQGTIQGIGRAYYAYNVVLRPTAARLAIEGCVDVSQSPCLLASVDGFWTVRVPKSRPIVGLFMLTNEPAMSDEDKRLIGSIYQQDDWRALARGKSGRWYPIAGAPSESDAIKQALASCAEHEGDCHIHAISNFRVADDK
jgi:DNA-binding response OmpR family regulator